jgi:chaperonin GroES
MLPIQPLGDYVLVKPLEPGAAGAAGLALPASASRDQPRRAVVLAVGPGRRTGEGLRVAPALDPGDLVVLGAHTGTDVRVGSVGLLLVRECHVFARVSE